MSVQVVAVGQPYPFPLATREGAAAQFLKGNDNVLQVAMPALAGSEVRAIRKNPLRAGLIVDLPLILWVFRFDADLIFDCPFDVRRIEAEQRWLPDISNTAQRLAIEIHLVDSASRIVRGLRGITLAPALTVRFFSAVQDQLVASGAMEPIYERYCRLPLATLAERADLVLCGA